MGRAPRSLKVHPQFINRIKQSVVMNGYASQSDLKDELQLSNDTVNGFLNGRAVDALNAQEICRALNLEVDEYCVPGNWSMENEVQTALGPLATVPSVIDAEYADVKDTSAQDAAKVTENIEQIIETVEEQAIAAARAGRVTVNSGDGSTQSTAETEADKHANTANPTDRIVKQSIKTVKRGGIAIGSTDSMTVHQSDQSE